MPQVSLLLPTYKPQADHISETVKNLRAQTFTDWELIICDEPTNTNTTELLRDILKDPRVQFYTNETLLGIGPNWNRCLSRATGEFIQYMFQDDIWHPTYLEESANTLKADNTIGFTAAYHDYQYEDEVQNKRMYEGIQTLRKQLVGKKHHGETFLLNWLERGLHPNLIGEPPFVMMRKSVMDQVGKFHESLPQFLDSEYWTKLLMITDFYFIEQSLGAFRVHSGAASAENQRQGKGLTDRLVTIDYLSKHGTPKIRQAAKQTLQQSLPRMIAKYLERKQSGAQTPGVAGTGMKQFIARHPWLALQAALKAVLFKRQYDSENAQLEQAS